MVSTVSHVLCPVEIKQKNSAIREPEVPWMTTRVSSCPRFCCIKRHREPRNVACWSQPFRGVYSALEAH